MSAMKEMFIEIQEKTYKKLENMGVPRETIYKFEEVLPDYELEDFAEGMAGYQMAISVLSEMMGYTEKALWHIWEGIALEDVEESLKERWDLFKRITREKDW